MGTFQVNGKINSDLLYAKNHIKIGTDLEIYNINRAELSVVSSGDYPGEIWLGTNGSRVWSISARASSDEGRISFYSGDTGHIFYINKDGSSYLSGCTFANGVVTGSLSGNADTATKLATARTLTVGSTGKTFNGSANVSWSHAEIGATVSNTWTGGTTAGPTIKTTVNGVTGTAVTIPSASTSASGVITTGNQEFAGQKTFRYPKIKPTSTSASGVGLFFLNNKNTTVADLWYSPGDPNNVTTGYFRFEQYSPNSTANNTTTGYAEIYSLPTVSSGLTANKSYEIFTSKSYTTLDSRYVNVTGDTMTGNLTVGSSAYGVITSTDGTVTLAVKTDGGWSRGMYMKQTSTSNTSKNTGGIGWYGSGATCNYCWIGTGYESPWAKITPAGYLTATRVYGAVWNDYAEFRNQDEEIEPGYCVTSSKFGKVYKTVERLQYCEGIVSDTYGFSIGETDNCKTPLAVSGRVLVYYDGDIDDYHVGDVVCATKNGLITKMTREEIKEYPDRIVGTVSEIPSYDTWGSGNVSTAGRIWIKVK